MPTGQIAQIAIGVKGRSHSSTAFGENWQAGVKPVNNDVQSAHLLDGFLASALHVFFHANIGNDGVSIGQLSGLFRQGPSSSGATTAIHLFLLYMSNAAGLQSCCFILWCSSHAHSTPNWRTTTCQICGVKVDGNVCLLLCQSCIALNSQ